MTICFTFRIYLLIKAKPILHVSSKTKLSNSVLEFIQCTSTQCHTNRETASTVVELAGFFENCISWHWPLWCWVGTLNHFAIPCIAYTLRSNYSLWSNFVEWFLANNSKTSRQTVMELCMTLPLHSNKRSNVYRLSAQTSFPNGWKTCLRY